MVYPFKYWTNNGTVNLTMNRITNEPTNEPSMSSTRRRNEPLQNLYGVARHQLTRKQKNNRWTNELKRSKSERNGIMSQDQNNVHLQIATVYGLPHVRCATK